MLSFYVYLVYCWLRICLNHHTCIRASLVNSGWKLVPKMLPCRTAIMSPASSFVFACESPDFILLTLPGSLARTSTGDLRSLLLDRTSSTTGARMNTPENGTRSDSDWRKGRSRSDSKLSIWRPKWFRWTRTLSPPMSSWPPFFVAFASSERRMRPAHVPHVGRFWTLEII